MEPNLIVEAYAELVQAYGKIETYSALLQLVDVAPALRKHYREQIAKETEKFLSILDRQVDARLAELMDQARYTLVEDIMKRNQEQARPTPSLVLAH